jgi:hypothetical protein
MGSRGRLTTTLVALIVLATVAFAVGAAIEKSQHHVEGSAAAALRGADLIRVESEKTDSHQNAAPERHRAEPSTSGAESPTSHSGEGGGESASAHPNESRGSESATEHAGETHSERLRGLDPEATGLVVVAVVVSLILALAVWHRPDHTLLLLLVAVAMLAFAALDIREAIHQGEESNGSLLLLASLVAALHLSAGALALYLSRLSSRHLNPV